MRRGLLVVAVLSLVACSTPSDPTGFSRPGLIRLANGSEAVDRGTVTASGTVTVTMGEFFFEPTIIDAPAGTSLEITLVNGGDNVHDFESGEVDVTLAQGNRTKVTIHVPDAGAVVFECKFHLPRAMRGEVRAA
jgi:plastocyanin